MMEKVERNQHIKRKISEDTHTHGRPSDSNANGQGLLCLSAVLIVFGEVLGPWPFLVCIYVSPAVVVC